MLNKKVQDAHNKDRTYKVDKCIYRDTESYTTNIMQHNYKKIMEFSKGRSVNAKKQQPAAIVSHVCYTHSITRTIR